MKTKNNSVKQALIPSAMLLISSMLAANTHAQKTATSTASQQSLDYMVAVVNTSPILASELAIAVQNAKSALAASNQAQPTDEASFSKAVLERLITRTSQMELIERSGQRLNDEAINAMLLNIAKKRGLSSLTELQNSLEADQEGNYAKLRKQVREELTINELRNQALRERVKISDKEVENYLNSSQGKSLFNTDFHTYHFRVNIDLNNASLEEKNKAMALAGQIKAALEANQSVEQILANYQDQASFGIQGGDMGFHPQKALPPYMKESLLTIGVGQTTEPVIQSDGIHIAKLIDKKEEAGKTEQEWQVRHILIKPNQMLSNEQAQQTTNELYERLRRGENFSTLATTYSDDPGSARKGGSLDWVRKGVMVPAFEAEMINTPNGDFSKPFQSQFGWHILKIDNVRTKDTTQEYKQNLAREAIFRQKSEKAMQDWMKELRDSAYVNIIDPRYKS